MNLEKERQLDERLWRRKLELPDCANEFLRSIELDKEIQTQIEYAKDIHLFLEFLCQEVYKDQKGTTEITLSDLEKVSEYDVLNFLDYLSCYEKEFTTVGGNKTVQEFRNGPQGKERKRASLKMFYDYFIIRGKLKTNPMQNIDIKVKKSEIKPRLSYNDVELMLDAALNTNPDEFRGLRNYVILKVLAYTGIRISELTDISMNNIWKDRNEMVITRKGGYEEVLYINKNIRDDLYGYLKMREKIENIQKGHENALFISQRMRRMDPRSIRKMIQILAEKVGIGIKVTPHTFRRTFGWKHYNDNKDLELTAKVLGHESAETTRRSYASADESRTRDSLDSFGY